MQRRQPAAKAVSAQHQYLQRALPTPRTRGSHCYDLYLSGFSTLAGLLSRAIWWVARAHSLAPIRARRV